MTIRALAYHTLALFVLVWTGCPSSTASSEKEGQGPAPRDVVVAPVERTMVTLTSDVVGTIQPRRVVRVASTIEGRVADVHVDVGDTVTPEQPLVGLDDAIARAELAQADAARRRLDGEAARVRRLVAQGLGEERRLEAAEAELVEAQARVRRLELMVQAHQVTSPLRGVVTRRSVEAGEVVRAGDELLTVTDVGTLVLHANLPTAEAATVTSGATVAVRVDGGAPPLVRGTIARTWPVADADTHRTRIEIQLDASWPQVRPGAIGMAAIPVQDLGAVVTVPSEALVRGVGEDPEEARVIVVDGTTARWRSVRAGPRVGARTVVVEGLEEGDRVITRGGQGLEDGAPVRCVPASEQGPR